MGEHHTDLRGGSHTDHGDVLFAAAERALIVFAVAGYEFHAPGDHGDALLSTGRAFTFRGFKTSHGLFLHALVAEPDHGSVVGMRVKNIIHGAGLQGHQRIVGMVGEILVVERSWVTHADAAVLAGEPDPCSPSAITAVNHRHAGLEVVFGQFDDRTVVDAPFLRGDVGDHTAELLDPQLHLHVQEWACVTFRTGASVGDERYQRVYTGLLLARTQGVEPRVHDGEPVQQFAIDLPGFVADERR